MPLPADLQGNTVAVVTSIYLHGFASSPQSSKAIRVAEALRPLGITTQIPDLNQPSFRDMTVTRMIDRVREAADGPLLLVGSSLGAFVAVNAAAKVADVRGIVLLAPAFDFGADDDGKIGEVSIADWKARGSCEIFHYAWERTETLDYALYEDAHRYDAFALDLAMPVLVFQGTRDTVVDPAVVRRWCDGRPNVRLIELDDDHQLQASIDLICEETAAFARAIAPR